MIALLQGEQLLTEFGIIDVVCVSGSQRPLSEPSSIASADVKCSELCQHVMEGQSANVRPHITRWTHVIECTE